jgi:guanosine-3',5'-bis(diphosphate) 3'-pyrophosphohydrolase
MLPSLKGGVSGGRMKYPDPEISAYREAVRDIENIHQGQVRKFTLLPYSTHPIRVANLVLKYKESHCIDRIVLAALYHDVLEDTDLTYNHLAITRGKEVADLVQEVTSDPRGIREQGKTLYLQKKLQGMSSWALVIKLCDRLDNCLDFVFAPKEFQMKYAKETLHLLQSLLRGMSSGVGRKLTETHRRIIDAILSTLVPYVTAWEGEYASDSERD